MAGSVMEFSHLQSDLGGIYQIEFVFHTLMKHIISNNKFFFAILTFASV